MFPIKRLPLMLLLALLPSVLAADSGDSKLLAQGRVDDAIVSLQARISAAPQDAESHNLLCRAYFALADWDTGISACERAVALAPENANIISGWDAFTAKRQTMPAS